MPRKDRGEGDGGKGSKNPLADMFNLQMPEDDEESLMAELAALQGVKPASKGRSRWQSEHEIFFEGSQIWLTM